MDVTFVAPDEVSVQTDSSDSDNPFLDRSSASVARLIVEKAEKYRSEKEDNADSGSQTEEEEVSSRTESDADTSLSSGHRLQKERWEKMARERGKANAAAAVVQDRSKSKAARLRERAKRQRHGDRSYSSSDLEIDARVKGERRRKHSRRHSERIRKSTLAKFLDLDQHEDRGRGRIVLPPSTHLGIFGRGASSGQYFPYSKKRLPDQRGDDMRRGGMEKRRKTRSSSTPPAATGRDYIDIASANESSSGVNTTIQRLQDTIASLERELHDLQGEIKIQSPAIQPLTPSRNATLLREGEGTAAMHVTRKRCSGSVMGKRLGVLERDPQRQGIDASSRITSSHTERSKTEQNTKSPPIPRALPPLLAFDRSRPHQPSNAWRGQHTLHPEPDLTDLRRRHSAAHQYPRLRHRQSPLRNDEIQAGEEWEVMPAEEVTHAKVDEIDRDCFFLDTCHYDCPQLNRQATSGVSYGAGASLDERRYIDPEDKLYGGEERCWVDASVHSEAMQAAPFLQNDSFDAVDWRKFGMSGVYDKCDTYCYDEGNDIGDLFDQEAWGEEDAWCDQVDDADWYDQEDTLYDRLSPPHQFEGLEAVHQLARFDEFEQSHLLNDHLVTKVTPTLSVLHNQIQPTVEELRGFWQAQT